MISPKFPRYTEYAPSVPVWCITPNTGGNIHRFFDTSPFSPSGRYLAVLRMSREDRLPKPGEKAKIVLIDLRTAGEWVVAETRGWETQLGANINWGETDQSLFFNDVNVQYWQAYCVKLNPFTGEQQALQGSIYRISPDGRYIISASLEKMRRTQDGYGVVVPDEHVPRNNGLPSNDGLFITDTETGEKKLVASIDHIFKMVSPAIDRRFYENAECYGFHCKFNPQGNRILFTLRWFDKNQPDPWNMEAEGIDYMVVTMNPDGTDILMAVGPEQWRKTGHHINWFPDGLTLSMNLCIDDDGSMYFVQVNEDGTNMQKMLASIPGSGHPTVHPNGHHILTDAYEHEPLSPGDGTVPIRLIDIRTEKEETLIRVNVANPGVKCHKALRVDPHPAWDPSHRMIAFNGFVGGTRRVFVADLSRKIQ